MFMEPMTVVSSSAFFLPQKLFFRGDSLSISLRRSLVDFSEDADDPDAAALLVLGAVKKPAMLPARAPASWTKRLVTARRSRPPFIE